MGFKGPIVIQDLLEVKVILLVISSSLWKWNSLRYLAY